MNKCMDCCFYKKKSELYNPVIAQLENSKSHKHIMISYCSLLNSEVLPFEERNCKRFKKKDCKSCDQIKELYPGSGLKYCELLIKVNGLCMLED